MICLDENGNLIRLGARLTTPGGEGVIYELAGDPSMVAKIYHPGQVAGKTAKLRYLRGLQSQQLHSVAALPTALLFHANQSQTACGFTMPLVKGNGVAPK